MPTTHSASRAATATMRRLRVVRHPAPGTLMTGPLTPRDDGPGRRVGGDHALEDDRLLGVRLDEMQTSGGQLLDALESLDDVQEIYTTAVIED